MSLEERPWENSHHRTSIYDSDATSLQILPFDPPKIIPLTYMTIQTMHSEGNLGNISNIMLIDILVKTSIVENIQTRVDCSPEEIASFTCLFKEYHDVFAWSYEEIPGIYPSIIEHELKVYENLRPVQQRLRPFHPRKTTAIETEVEKLLSVDFIYPFPLTEWVSNLVPVEEKKGTICICVDYHDLKTACPKDNYPTLFIDQIIDDYTCCDSSFMDGFSSYNQIAIKHADQHKTTFIDPWGTFVYRKIQFGIKNVGTTFQRDNDYAFHDIIHIVQAYLDDLLSHSRK